MERLNLIALAIPIFALSVGLEALLDYRAGKQTYRFADTWANLGCGLTQGVSDVFLKTIFFAGYLYVHEHWALLTPAIWAQWVIAFFGYDFFYYLWHRSSHRVNFIWAAHAVHHQSQDFNLSVALRQSSFGLTTSWVYYLPLALLGVRPEIFLATGGISLLYQFWIHSKSIGKLGWFELVFNTPSHHRVHHGVNPKYIDKNYAAILIIWDRWLGTFQEEEEEVVYGTVVPFTSWNPLWANLYYWGAMWKEAKAMSRLRDKILVWVMPPGWRPGIGEATIPAVDAGHFVKWDSPPVSEWVKSYVFFQYCLLIAGTFLFLQYMVGASLTSLAWPAAVLIGGAWTMALILERKPIAIPLEVVRVAAGLLFLVTWK